MDEVGNLFAVNTALDDNTDFIYFEIFVCGLSVALNIVLQLFRFKDNNPFPKHLSSAKH